MRTIIAGSRSCNHLDTLYDALKECDWIPTVVLSGTAGGADALGEIWARENGVAIERFAAQWLRDGPGAGAVRNSLMADNAEALIALWDGSSSGTRHMIKVARKKGLRVHVYYFADLFK